MASYSDHRDYRDSRPRARSRSRPPPARPYEYDSAARDRVREDAYLSPNVPYAVPMSCMINRGQTTLTPCTVDDRTGTRTTTAIHTHPSVLRTPQDQRARLAQSFTSADHGHQHPSSKAKLPRSPAKHDPNDHQAKVVMMRRRPREKSIRNLLYKMCQSFSMPKSADIQWCTILRKMLHRQRAYQHLRQAKTRRLQEAGLRGQAILVLT
jgi:hypothetical protein